MKSWRNVEKHGEVTGQNPFLRFLMADLILPRCNERYEVTLTQVLHISVRYWKTLFNPCTWCGHNMWHIIVCTCSYNFELLIVFFIWNTLWEMAHFTLWCSKVVFFYFVRQIKMLTFNNVLGEVLFWYWYWNSAFVWTTSFRGTDTMFLNYRLQFFFLLWYWNRYRGLFFTNIVSWLVLYDNHGVNKYNV